MGTNETGVNITEYCIEILKGWNCVIRQNKMASGTGNSFVGAGVSSDAAGSITAAAYPGGVPSGMNNPINQYTSSEMTSSFPGYLFKSLYGGGKRRKSRVQRRKRRIRKRYGGGRHNDDGAESVKEFFDLFEKGHFSVGDEFTIVAKEPNMQEVNTTNLTITNLKIEVVVVPCTYSKNKQKLNGTVSGSFKLRRSIYTDPQFENWFNFFYRVDSPLTFYITRLNNLNRYLSMMYVKYKFQQTTWYHEFHHDEQRIEASDLKVFGVGKNAKDFALVTHNATRKVNANKTVSRVLGNRDLARRIAKYLPSSQVVQTGHRKTAKRSQSKSPPKKRSPSIDEVTDGMKDLMKPK